MADLIDRQEAIVTAVKAAIDWHKLANPQYSIAYCIGEAMRELPSADIDLSDFSDKLWRAAYERGKAEAVPSVDAVEVVRCKDCKWFNDIGCSIRIVDDSDKPTENDYCSYGERKDGNI